MSSSLSYAYLDHVYPDWPKPNKERVWDFPVMRTGLLIDRTQRRVLVHENEEENVSSNHFKSTPDVTIRIDSEPLPPYEENPGRFAKQVPKTKWYTRIFNIFKRKTPVSTPSPAKIFKKISNFFRTKFW